MRRHARLLAGRGSLRAAGAAATWEWSGGLIGAFFVTMTIIAVPRLGTLTVMAIVIAGQLVSAALLDQFGVFGMRQIRSRKGHDGSSQSGRFEDAFEHDVFPVH